MSRYKSSVVISFKHVLGNLINPLIMVAVTINVTALIERNDFGTTGGITRDMNEIEQYLSEDDMTNSFVAE